LLQYESEKNIHIYNFNQNQNSIETIVHSLYALVQ